MTDEELARGIQQGRGECVRQLVERHHSPLMGFLYRMTDSDRLLAEDLSQEVFLRMMRSIRQYTYPRPFKPWLYMIATNLVRDHFKRVETRRVGSLADEQWDLMGDNTDGPDDALQLETETRAIVEALRQLPEHQREVLILRYYQSLSVHEIALALNIPEGTVKSRISIGLRRLRTLVMEAER